ncbi:thiamine pyrophosphate-binding protein [Candidatus Margulisiibacteriota bacterium]
MKLTDYVAEFLSRQGIKYVFGLTGGAAVHLFDSLDKNKKITPIYNHHEQAAALAAEAYARTTNNLGAAIVTTGPGGVNAITGLVAAWLDSIPCIFISGQTRKEHSSHNKKIRQLGSQEFDILSLVKPVSKYAVMIDDPKMIKYHLQKAVYVARSGRPGPVWIDLPLNLQWSEIMPERLKSFKPPAAQQSSGPKIKKCFKLLKQARRPLVLAGHGIRLSHAEKEFKKFIKKSRIPFVSSWNAADLFPEGREYNLGVPGIFGQRGANLAVQNCDLLISIGSHLAIPLTGIQYASFARGAKIVMVDIDPVELAFKTVRVDLSICADAGQFLCRVQQKAHVNNVWQERCAKYQAYNVMPAQWKKQKKYVNPYVLVDFLYHKLGKDDQVVVDGGGTINQIAFQAFTGQKIGRIIISAGICSMGTGLPESIGACFARGRKRTICLCGDGSMQLNIQELQTIAQHRLPVIIFVFNNSGYLAIRNTQDGFLKSNYTGSAAGGGLRLPDFKKVAKAYGIESVQIKNHKELAKKVKNVLSKTGPVVCEIMVSPKQEIIPRTGFNRPLEDMYPYLSRKEVEVQNG